MDDTRMRSVLEVIIAILLGLVSVATAAGAYQATEWGRQSAQAAAIGGELRDRSLGSFVASRLATFDDGERLVEAVNLEFQVGGTDDPDEIRARQDVLLDGASPELRAAWDAWLASGYSEDAFPLLDPAYRAATLGPTFGSNAASAAAYGIADSYGDRSFQLTIASVVFALALLLLGVAGANTSIRVMAGLAGGGAAVFGVGLAITLLAVVG